MASDLKSGLAMMTPQGRPHVKLMGNPAVIPTNKKVSQNNYEGANFNLANGNRNIPLEKLILIDMLIIKLN